MSKVAQVAKKLEAKKQVKPEPKALQPVACRYGPACTMTNCKYFHEKPVKAAKVQLQRAGDEVGVSANPTTPIIFPYMMTLLLPKEYMASIPDSIMEPHKVKNIVTNVSVTVPAACTNVMFIIYPNNSTNLIGWYYFKMTSGWVLGGSMTLSQDIATSWEKGRKVSQLVQIVSNTLPSGMFTINGQFNAVFVNGTLSEVVGLDPATLLGQVSNSFDKVAGVGLTDGVSILSMPYTYDQPMYRLNDSAPYSGDGGTSLRIRDASGSKIYEAFTAYPNRTFAASGTTPSAPNFDQSFVDNYNVDSISGISVNGHVKMSMTRLTYGSSNQMSVQVVVLFTFMDYFGNAMPIVLPDGTTDVGTANIVCSVTTPVINSAYNTLDFPYSCLVTREQILAFGPICGVNVKVLVGVIGTGNQIQASILNQCQFIVPNALRSGESDKIALVGLQQVSPGTTIVVNAYTNMELVPNAVLRPNIDTTYGEVMPNSQSVIDQLLANQEQFGIRNIWETRSYEALHDHLLELCVVNRHAGVQRAGVASSLISAFKKYALPMVYKSYPEARIMVNAASSLWKLLREIHGSPSVMKAGHGRVIEPATRAVSLKTDVGNISVGSVALFPTIGKTDLGADTYALYAAVLGNFSSLLANECFVRMRSNYKIYGWTDTSTELTFATDVTLLPVGIELDGTIYVVHGCPVAERSCEAAIALVCTKQFGALPYAITGAVVFDGISHAILPNSYLTVKLHNVHSERMCLAANGETADYNVTTVEQVDPYKVVRLPKRTYNHMVGTVKAMWKGDDYTGPTEFGLPVLHPRPWRVLFTEFASSNDPYCATWLCCRCGTENRTRLRGVVNSICSRCSTNVYYHHGKEVVQIYGNRIVMFGKLAPTFDANEPAPKGFVDSGDIVTCLNLFMQTLGVNPLIDEGRHGVQPAETFSARIMFRGINYYVYNARSKSLARRLLAFILLNNVKSGVDAADFDKVYDLQTREIERAYFDAIMQLQPNAEIHQVVQHAKAKGLVVHYDEMVPICVTPADSGPLPECPFAQSNDNCYFTFGGKILSEIMVRQLDMNEYRRKVARIRSRMEQTHRAFDEAIASSKAEIEQLDKRKENITAHMGRIKSGYAEALARSEQEMAEVLNASRRK